MREAPYHPDNQDNISVTRLSQSRMINGINCTGFEYILDLGERTKSGTVWLHAESGLPVEQEFSYEPLPRNVREIEYQAFYRHHPDGTYYISKMTYSGIGQMLFIKKTFHGEFTYSEYWRRPQTN